MKESYLTLPRLENLHTGKSLIQWEMIDGKSNPGLDELKLLPHLTSLDIAIPDAKLLRKDIDIVFDKLVRYKIFVGDIWSWEENFETNTALKQDYFHLFLES